MTDALIILKNNESIIDPKEMTFSFDSQRIKALYFLQFNILECKSFIKLKY